jgi:hypothetical protein
LWDNRSAGLGVEECNCERKIAMKKHSLKIGIWILFVLLLAGCHKLEVTTRIEPTGSGELQTGVGFSAEERANMEKQNSNPLDFCNSSQTPPNITVVEEQHGEETWCVTTTQFKNLDELRTLYGQREGITINRLEISDGKFYYDVDIDTLSEDSSFSALTEITWKVIFPGTPVSHNADQVNENTLTWTLTSKDGIINLRAESEAPRGFNFPPCGTAFIGLGAGLIYFRRRGKNLLN